MPGIEILDFKPEPSLSSRILGYWLDGPKPRTISTLHAFEVEGWVLATPPALGIELVQDDCLVKKVPLTVPRPDVLAERSTSDGTLNCGFWMAVGTLGLAPTFEVKLNVVHADSARETLGILRGRHEPTASGFHSSIQPLMISSLARAGTTWLMQLLAEHPQITMQRIFPYETRASAYWMHVLKVLTDPSDQLHSANSETFHENISWAGHPPYYYLTPTRDPLYPGHQEVDSWIGTTCVADVVAFCQRCVESFYSAIAASQGAPNPTYFVEKYPQASLLPWVVCSIYPKAREIFLVRDMRDVFSSMQAFNKKRGFPGFGRRPNDRDEDFVATLRKSALQLLRDFCSRSARSHLVRYEDLIAFPQATLRVLLTYLDLDASNLVIEGMLARAAALSCALTQHRTVPNPTESIGRWNRDLSETQKSACRSAFYEFLQYFDYLEFPRPPSVS